MSWCGNLVLVVFVRPTLVTWRGVSPQRVDVFLLDHDFPARPESRERTTTRKRHRRDLREVLVNKDLRVREDKDFTTFIVSLRQRRSSDTVLPSERPITTHGFFPRFQLHLLSTWTYCASEQKHFLQFRPSSRPADIFNESAGRTCRSLAPDRSSPSRSRIICLHLRTASRQIVDRILRPADPNKF